MGILLKTKTTVIALGIAFTSTVFGFWNEEPDTRSKQTLKNWCELRSENTYNIKSESAALICADFYFLNQQYEDESRPFSKVLTFVKRAEQLNPANHNTVATIIWLYYSHWVMFHEKPEVFDHFETSLKKALLWVSTFESRFDKNAVAIKNLADHVYTIAVFYKPELTQRAIDLYLKADHISKNMKLKIRCRLQVAHIFRKYQKKSEAIESYYKVLEIDPLNKIAKKYLLELENDLLDFDQLALRRKG